MNKSPAFQFYPKDWLSDANVRVMTHEQRGIYIDLLCHCWLEGSIPSSLEILSRITQVEPKRMDELWPLISVCFRRRGSKQIHLRLLKELDKQRIWKEKSALGGKHSARLRKELKGGSTTLGKGGSRVVQPKGNTSVFSLRLQSSSSDLLKSEDRPVESVENRIETKSPKDAEKVNTAIRKLEAWVKGDPSAIWIRFIKGFGASPPGPEYLAEELLHLTNKLVKSNGVKNPMAYALRAVEQYHKERKP